MRIAYIDCFAGIAGDMFLGALIDAGVPTKVLEDATAALGVGASLRIEKVDRSGISSTKVHVLEDGRIAEQVQPAFRQQQETQHQHKTGHEHTHNQEYGHADNSGHLHGDDAHGNEHSHNHGRSLTSIRGLIHAAALADEVKLTAIRVFELLGNAEAKIHNVSVDDIHFHEVGAVDTIVDVVAASAGIHHLSVGAWYCSPINVGSGTVKCAHGTFPVPAPATADLLRGFPTYSAHVEQELVTPTGAALLRALNPRFGEQPAMRVEQIGYGAGTRNSKGFPNVVRLSLGEGQEINTVESGDGSGDVVTVLETALDDLSPQVIAHVAEVALTLGALDVMLTPVIMKKGRPGTLLTVLCNAADSAAMERLLLSETSTLGLRIRQDRRACLERRHETVTTQYGEIRIKIGSQGGVTLNAAPEFEDCRAAAAKHHVAVKQIQQAAVTAYFNSKGRP